jgi:transcriptional regulator with XRE-family HTH domain
MQRSKGDRKVAARLKELDRAVRAAIKNGRNDHDQKQQQLAEILGWSTEVISNIEKGRRSVTVSELIVISEAIEEDPEEVFRRILQWRKQR